MNDTEQTTARCWYEKHAAAYADVLRASAEHPAALTDEPAHAESLAWLRNTLLRAAAPTDEESAAGVLTEVYHALGHIALSIREHAPAQYRADELYQRVNAMRPPMVRAHVTRNF